MLHSRDEGDIQRATPRALRIRPAHRGRSVPPARAGMHELCKKVPFAKLMNASLPPVRCMERSRDEIACDV